MRSFHLREYKSIILLIQNQGELSKEQSFDEQNGI